MGYVTILLEKYKENSNYIPKELNTKTKNKDKPK